MFKQWCKGVQRNLYLPRYLHSKSWGPLHPTRNLTLTLKTSVLGIKPFLNLCYSCDKSCSSHLVCSWCRRFFSSTEKRLCGFYVMTWISGESSLFSKSLNQMYSATASQFQSLQLSCPSHFPSPRDAEYQPASESPPPVTHPISPPVNILTTFASIF